MTVSTEIRSAEELFTGPDLFAERLRAEGLGPLERGALEVLQINLGYRCNQACQHCHVEAGPKRSEIMDAEVMARILAWARAAGVRAVDLTGGAPELNPHFRRFVDAFLALGCTVTVRCNLTVLFERGQEDLADWYAERGVRLVCSLPCYTRENVDSQRGRGVFDRSILALRRLNALGYGRDPRLVLDLVYNPGGAFLPPPQAQLEADYRRRLAEDFGVVFTKLLALANLPIGRFVHWLEREGKLEGYLALLAERFNPATLPQLMCRQLLSVDWRGFVYDCDFNQMRALPFAALAPRRLWELDPKRLRGMPIATGTHCLGCTAGSGSSCGGALVEEA
jgi:radical SAM/Cys-rich protein